MHSFEYILIMLVAVLASSFIGARFPHISTPLVQIATGIVLTLLPISFEMHLEPELFMVLFIAPLLFDDAEKMDKPSLWRLKKPVLLLALGLVFCTVLILGFAVNLFAPSIPLAAAFALAAALAPTDAVSVSSLKQNARISSEQGKLLQGESLLNDASSIVSFNFAVAAAITGTFSVWEAEGVFLLQFLGGLALGVAVMLVRYALIRFLRSRGMESVSFHVLFEVVTPFLVYLLAEFVGVSGIIAVVAAGIAHSFEPRAVTPSSARLNVVSSSVWSVFSFTLNGLVFLILGTQLPYVAERVWTGTEANTNYLIFFIVLILFVVIALRFLWVFIMRRNVNLARVNSPAHEEIVPLRPYVDSLGEEEDLFSSGFGELSFAEREVALEEELALKREQYRKARSLNRKARRATRRKEKRAARADKHYWRLHLADALLLSLSGVKGAITLAVILSVPLTLDGVTPFPERDLLIFLASGVILLSLLVATVFVPLIAPKEKKAKRATAELAAIIKIYQRVIDELTENAEPDERSAVNEVARQYYSRITNLKSRKSLSLPNETEVRRYIIELQLQNTQRLTDEGKINNITALFYINSLSRQLAKTEHHSMLSWEIKAFVDQLTHWWKVHKELQKLEDKGTPQERRTRRFDLHALQIDNYRYVINKLCTLEPTDDLPEYTVGVIRAEMEQRLARHESRWGYDGRSAATIVVEARALDLERRAINEAQEEGEISNETAKTLRDNVALMELNIEDQLE